MRARSELPQAAIEPITFSGFSIDRRGGRLTRGGETIPLRPKTWAVLQYLVERPGVLVSAEELLDAVWPDVTVTPDTLRKSIGELRLALDDDSKKPRCIETVHRRGFRFIAETVGCGSLSAAIAGEQPATSHQPPASVPLVGRDSELQRLASRLASAQAGDRQIVFVTGPAGVGKTALVEAFLDSAAATAAVGRGACIEQHGAREPYMPVLEALERLARGPEAKRTVDLLRRVAPTWLAQMPWLFDDDADALRLAPPPANGERMLREFAAFAEALAGTTTVVLVLEDLHWSDAPTVDLLSLLAQRRETARLLVVGTYRPAEIAIHDHALAAAARTLKLRRQCVDVPVHELRRDDVGRYLAQRFPGSELPSALADVLHRHTDGNPLFLRAVVDHMVTRGSILETAPGWALTIALDKADLGIPEDVRQMVVTQLEALVPADREMLEAASVGGVEFAVQAIAPALGYDRDTVEARCETLARAHRFLQAAGSTEWPDGSVARRYRFTHELYRQTVYREVPDGRRRKLHQGIGEALEAVFGERTPEIASLLAMHFDHSRDHARALRYFAAAAARARQRYALREAMGNLETAILHAGQLPDEDERCRRELELRLMLMPILSDLHGFASEQLTQNCARAHELCSRSGTPEQLFFVVNALAHVHAARADIVLAGGMAAELRRLADGLSQVHRLIADSVLMRNAVYAGRFVDARRLADERLPLPDEASPVQLPQAFGAEPLVAVRYHYAFSSWMLGDATEARAVAREALERADTYGAPFTLAAALWFSGVIEIFCRDPGRARVFAHRCATLCAEHGLSYWQAMSAALSACAQVQEGQLHEGITELEAARSALAAMGAMLFRTYVLAFLAEGHLRAGSVAAGLAAVDEGLSVAESTVDRSYWPELWRLKGELLWAASAESGRKDVPKVPEAERCLLRAVELARASSARSLELRAVSSLTRMRLAQRRPAEARRMLRQICDRFDAGDDGPDLAAARALLAGHATRVARAPR